MSYYEPYSVRKARAEQGDAPDVYQYDVIPKTLRVQLCQIFSAAIGPYYIPGPYAMHEPPNNNDGWEAVRDILKRSLGVHSLSGKSSDCKVDILESLENGPTDRVLDIVEVCCRLLFHYVKDVQFYELKSKGVSARPEGALNEINYRFRQAGVGFQFEGGKIIRVDSQHLHSEVVKPALGLLSDARFKGAEEEFREAHEHYRAGDYREAISLANNAFESTMKCVCEMKNWEYEEGARASDLLKVLRKNRLWPDYLDASFDQLQATLANGLPKVRNNEGSHGQGALPREAPPYVAGYALHLAAVNIVFIVEAALSGRAAP